MFYTFHEILFHEKQGSFTKQPIVTWLSLKSAQDTLNYSTVHNPRVHIKPFKLKSSVEGHPLVSRRFEQRPEEDRNRTAVPSFLVYTMTPLLTARWIEGALIYRAQQEVRMDDACLPHKTVSAENWPSPKGKKQRKLIKEKLHKDIVFILGIPCCPGAKKGYGSARFSAILNIENFHTKVKADHATHPSLKLRQPCN